MFDNVTKQQKNLLILTFLFAMFCGAYLYLTVFAPAVQDGILPSYSKRSDNDFIIQVAEYGRCIDSQFTCASYRIDSSGSLMLLPPTLVNSDPVVTQIRLSKDQIGEIRQLLIKDNLKSYAKPKLGATCNQADSDEFRYSITLEAEVYHLDTCQTEFGRDNDLYGFLQSFFAY